MNIESLTDGQRKVFDLVVLGHNIKEVATALGIGDKTVKAHVTKILKCFQCDSRARLIAQYYLARKHETAQSTGQSRASSRGATDQESDNGSEGPGAIEPLAVTDRCPPTTPSPGVSEGEAGAHSAAVPFGPGPSRLQRALAAVGVNRIGTVSDGAGDHAAAGGLKRA